MTINKDDAIKAIEGLVPKSVASGPSDIAYTAGLRHAIEAIRALPDVGWRGISEARQDGEWIVACRAGQEDSLGTVRWHKGRWTIPDGETWKQGWLTHFWPLPHPPEKA